MGGGLGVRRKQGCQLLRQVIPDNRLTGFPTTRVSYKILAFVMVAEPEG